MNEITAIIKGPVFFVVFNPKSVCSIFFFWPHCTAQGTSPVRG